MNSNSSRDKILIVDDNPENIWPLIENLESDYETLFATSGDKALNIAFSYERPELILLDIMMPGMDGYEVCSRLKADPYTRDIPVIFLSAKSEEYDETKGLELGARDYITKPFKMNVVRARIRTVLSLKKEMDKRVLLKKQMEDMNARLEDQVRTKVNELKEARETLHEYEKKYQYLFQNDKSEKGDRRRKILIVDDQPENIHILIENLEADYDVFFATNGEKALDIAFSDNSPDLFLLDIMMPKMSGYEVCSMLKANIETRDIPIIFITSQDQEEDETKGFKLGAVDFIAKPFRMPIVEARVNAALSLKTEMDTRIILTRKLENLNRNLEEKIREKTTELELAHENLKASEKEFRTIFENAIEGIFLSTIKGRFLSVSPSLAKILGYDSVQNLISSVTDIAGQLYERPEDRAKFIRILEEKGEISGFETRFKKKSGEIISVKITAKMMQDEKGNPLYYQGFLIDITEQKRAEELELANIRLLELDALKSALMSTASHDMRSPLTAILGLNDLIKLNFSKNFEHLSKGNQELEISSEKIKDHIKTIEKEVRRLIRLINDFLDLSKFESGCSEWYDRPVLLTEIIDQAVKVMQAQFLKKPNIDLKINCDKNLPVVTCDPDRMMQVIVNLLGNAVKFTETGKISVHALTISNKMIEVRVADTGPGIPEEEKVKIFDKFYQIKQGRVNDKGQRGTGLGLSICKQIIEHYGGRIWVESETGQGCTLIFRLPVKKYQLNNPINF